MNHTKASHRAALAVATAAVVLSGCSATNAQLQDHSAPASTQVTIPSENGPGVTDTTITLSSTLITEAGLGSGATQKERANAMNAVVDAFNAAGGIAGRKVQILQQDPGTSLVTERSAAYAKAQGLPIPDPTNGQAACDAYAKAGTPVFAFLGSDLVSAPLGTPATAACLNQAGHPVIGARGWSESDYQAAPATAGLFLSGEHWIDAVIAAGKDAGVIGNGGKTALITDSTSSTDIVDKVYRPALEKAGLTDAQVFPASPTMTQAQALNLALKLKSAGIDRIVYLAPSVDTPLLVRALMSVLPQQQYFPKQLILDGYPFGSNPPTQQMLDSVAAYDTRAALQIQPTPEQAARISTTPAGKLCDAAAKADPADQKYLDINFCDYLSLLKAALEASGSKYVNAQAFTVGLGKLGSSYPSPALFATAFSPDHHDGVAGIARDVYSAQCQCSSPDTRVIRF